MYRTAEAKALQIDNGQLTHTQCSRHWWLFRLEKTHGYVLSDEIFKHRGFSSWLTTNHCNLRQINDHGHSHLSKSILHAIDNRNQGLHAPVSCGCSHPSWGWGASQYLFSISANKRFEIATWRVSFFFLRIVWKPNRLSCSTPSLHCLNWGQHQQQLFTKSRAPQKKERKAIKTSWKRQDTWISSKSAYLKLNQSLRLTVPLNFFINCYHCVIFLKRLRYCKNVWLLLCDKNIW